MQNIGYLKKKTTSSYPDASPSGPHSWAKKSQLIFGHIVTFPRANQGQHQSTTQLDATGARLEYMHIYLKPVLGLVLVLVLAPALAPVMALALVPARGWHISLACMS